MKKLKHLTSMKSKLTLHKGKKHEKLKKEPTLYITTSKCPL